MSALSAKYENKIITIPNILSFLRLCMVPAFAYCYEKERYKWTAIILVISGITDIVDGFIARKFHMISNVGKVLDPIADKVTQIVLLGCLLIRFDKMFYLLVLMIIKELLAAISGMMIIRTTGKVFGADWHGKLNTVLLYAMMMLHVLWYNIPTMVSDVCIYICGCMMIISCIMYMLRNVRYLLNYKQTEKASQM